MHTARDTTPNKREAQHPPFAVGDSVLLFSHRREWVDGAYRTTFYDRPATVLELRLGQLIEGQWLCLIVFSDGEGNSIALVPASSLRTKSGLKVLRSQSIESILSRRAAREARSEASTAAGRGEAYVPVTRTVRLIFEPKRG